MSYRQLIEPFTVHGHWWHRTTDGRIQCDLCPRHCKLRDGQRGVCFVRKAHNDGIVLTSYGRASGFCIDPIEKKPLNHFYPGTSVLSFGTAGCNLGCRFCQNWDISKARTIDRLSSQAMPHEIAEAAEKSGCRSIAFTYNDPVIFAEYAIDCAKEAHRRGIRAVAVSAGYITEDARSDFFAQMDAVNIDLKAFTQQFYHKLCAASLEPVLQTLRWLKEETSVWFEVTTLLIPGHNDSEEEVRELAQWFLRYLGPEVPLHFTAFHPDYKMQDVAPTPSSTLTRAREVARAAGLHHVYTGNVNDIDGQSTYCASCGNLLIQRNWYKLGKWNLDSKGRCSSCGSILSGYFDPTPGNWGPRRLPVKIAH